VKRKNMRKKQIIEKLDSYKQFLDHFDISKERFFEFGEKFSISADIEKVNNNWEEIKNKIQCSTNRNEIYIRSYGRNGQNTDLFIAMYKELYPELTIKVDKTNNSVPKRVLGSATKQKINIHLENYQISHIFGNTKNIYMFEALWNIAYIPKIIDPLTGHEAMGDLSVEYKSVFRNYFLKKYEAIVNDYNIIIDKERARFEIYIEKIKQTDKYTKEKKKYDDFIKSINSEFKKIE
jgi:hypothetical protein